MHCRLGFFRTYDYRLLVAAELSTDISSAGRASIRTTRFDDEGEFLQAIVEAEYDPDTATSLLANALLALSSRSDGCQWTQIGYSEKQFATLGLLGFPGKFERRRVSDQDSPTEAHLRELLMQAPTPIAMFEGPQHVFTFMNPAYVQLANRVSAESLLGKPIRQAMPELQGQPYYGLLDKVYRTGEPYHGYEVPVQLRDEGTGQINDGYADFVYFPLKDESGTVFGILCQGYMVTETVLSRQVSEAREAKMFRQWAVLEAVYRKSPVAMALMDVHEYRVIRLNEANVKLIGLPEEEIVGKPVFELFPDSLGLRSLYERVLQGEEVRNVRLEMVGFDGVRHMTLSFSPVRDASGRIEAIASIAEDVVQPDPRGPVVVVNMPPGQSALPEN